VLQTPPLPVVIELGKDTPTAPEGLGKRIQDEIRARLLVTTDVSFCPTTRCRGKPTSPNWWTIPTLSPAVANA
jgi:hypothetical protein